MTPPDWQGQWLLASTWLDVAEADARVAGLCLGAQPPLAGIAAYHCQQAAEKILKGLLIRVARPIRRTHDLDVIAEDVVASMPSVGARIAFCRPLTAWGSLGRYPLVGEADVQPPSPDQVRQALRSLTDLLAFARQSGPASGT